MLEVLLDRMKRRKGLRGICCSKSAAAPSATGVSATSRAVIRCPTRTPLPPRAPRWPVAQGAKRYARLLPHLRRRLGHVRLAARPANHARGHHRFHRLLLASGAPINEINTLRKHFSAVKGGRLAMAAPEALKISLLLPDVPLRTLDALSSGPTSPDHSTVAEVRELLAKYDLAAKIRPPIRAFFERPILPESPGNKTWRPPFSQAAAGRCSAAAPHHRRRQHERRRRGIPRFGLRDSALQPRPGGKRAHAGTESRLPRGRRQLLRRLGLRRRRPLSARALPHSARPAPSASA